MLHKLIRNLAFLSVLLAAGFSLNSQAADADDPRVQEFTDAMTEQLGLTEEQAAQVHSINQQTFAQLAEVRAQGTENRREQFKLLRSIGSERNEAMEEILSPEQFAEFEETSKERRAQFKAYLQERKAAEN